VRTFEVTIEELTVIVFPVSLKITLGAFLGDLWDKATESFGGQEK
jgi:hypothetical protein